MPENKILNRVIEKMKEKEPESYQKYLNNQEALLDYTSKITGTAIKSVINGMAHVNYANIVGAKPEKVAEAIALAKERPVMIIRDNQLVPEFSGPDSQIWREVLMERKDKLNEVIPAIGRVEIHRNARLKWAGTGWLVDTDIIVTNRHVAEHFCKNNIGFTFKVGYPEGYQSAQIDFLEEDQRTKSLEYVVERVLWMTENLNDQPDIAFMRIKQAPGGPPLPKPLILASKAAVEDEVVVTVGYPARDRDVPDQNLVLHIFGNVYDKKRLAPGEIRVSKNEEIEHDCSTLGGNSGSPVIRLATGEVVGLHYAGAYLYSNYAVSVSRVQELLEKVKKNQLPRMIRNESIQPSTSSIVNLPSTLGNGAYTFDFQIPVRITVEVGNSVNLTPLNQVSAPISSQATPKLEEPAEEVYIQALQVAQQTLWGKPGILSIRLGYRFKKGWITNERVIVVEVDQKQTLPELRSGGKSLIQNQFMGIGVDVRTAAFIDQLARLGIELEAPKGPPKPGIYVEPPHLSLNQVHEQMKAIFHVSPDSGLPNLKKFLSNVQDHITATMYEWDSDEITKELVKAIRAGNRTLKMITQRAGTRKAVADVKTKLGNRFHHVWASVGPNQIVPKAYHIKVACCDRKSLWLSSGNWKKSGQPDIDPVSTNSTSMGPLQEYNREWHVIIENEKLAGMLEDYINWDFEEAQRVPEEEAPPFMPIELFVPEAAFKLVLEQQRAVAKYFAPLEINRVLKIQPLLTPDRDSRGRRMFLEHATMIINQAKSAIYIQNQSFNRLEENVDAFDRFFNVLKKKQNDGIRIQIIFRDAREFDSRESITNAIAQQKMLEELKEFGLDTDNIKVQVGCHTKAIIVDPNDVENAVVLFGSHNLTNSGALYNRDASLLVRDHEVANYFFEIFSYDWEVLAKQSIEEVVGGIRLAPANEATPPGFRRISI